MSDARDRRKLGVNRFSVLKAARKLTKDPEFDPDVTMELASREFAELVLAEIIGKPAAQAMRDDPSIDWEGLFSFIERILATCI